MEQEADTRESPETTSQGRLSPRRLGPGAAGVVSLVLASSVVFPFVGLVVAPLAILPIVQQLAAGRSTVAAWSWVLAGLVLVVLAGGGPVWIEIAIMYALVVVLPAVSIELWIRLRGNEARWVAATVGALILISLLATAAWVYPDDPVNGSMAIIREGLEFMAQQYEEAGIPRGRIDLALDSFEAVAKWILPSLIMPYFVLILFWIRPRLKALGIPVETAPFENYSSDDLLLWIFAGAGAGTLLIQGTFRWIAINLLVAVLILYFVHGLAIIRAHLARWIGRGWFVRWGVGFLCLQVPLPIVVATLGIVDSFYRLRPQPTDGGGNS